MFLRSTFAALRDRISSGVNLLGSPLVHQNRGRCSFHTFCAESESWLRNNNTSRSLFSSWFTTTSSLSLIGRLPLFNRARSFATTSTPLSSPEDEHHQSSAAASTQQENEAIASEHKQQHQQHHVTRPNHPHQRPQSAAGRPKDYLSSYVASPNSSTHPFIKTKYLNTSIYKTNERKPGDPLFLWIRFLLGFSLSMSSMSFS